VAVDSAGNAYISDSGNSRVLEFDSSAGANPRAKLVFGQHGSFSSGSCNADGVNADSLCRPSAVAVDNSGNLYVADHDNFRVLEYNAPRPANNTTADLVFGQNNSFFSNTNSCVAGASAGGLCTPNGLAVDSSGNLYIAGSSFSRVLEYNAPVATGHTSPDAVIGQPGFTASGCNNGGLGAAGLCAPFGVGIDSANDLFADFGNNRVVRYNNPLTTPVASTSANLVLGQISFAQNGVNLTKPDGLYWPAAVVVDTNSAPNHVYLADTNNSRVLGWFSVPELKYAGPPDLVIGQPGTRAGGCNQNHIDASGSSLPAADTLCTPGGVAVDPGGNLYVADSGNFRVLEFNAPFSSGKSADLSANIVFGQNGSFTTRIQNNGGVSATSMAAPGGIATDKLGRLYVADPINNRVLEYNAPASGNTIADAVFGQGRSFATSACNFDGFCNNAGCFTTADSLCNPTAVVLNSAGRLYIADSANNRVLIFNNPLAVAKAADIVIGQADFNGLNCGSLCAPPGGRGRFGRRPVRRQYRQLGREPV
jgi:sugar lactone lactonase YvrE